MLFLLDTNAFSDLMREHPQLDARLAALASSDRVVDLFNRPRRNPLWS